MSHTTRRDAMYNAFQPVPVLTPYTVCARVPSTRGTTRPRPAPASARMNFTERPDAEIEPTNHWQSIKGPGRRCRRRSRRVRAECRQGEQEDKSNYAEWRLASFGALLLDQREDASAAWLSARRAGYTR